MGLRMNAKMVLLHIVLLLSVVLGLSQAAAQAQADSDEPAAGEDFFEMSLEQLMDVEIVSTAALTRTSARMAPAAVTTITQEQILASGARSLFELLDIYVPNLQWIRHHWESDHLGLRGIINDRDDKYLLLVNGRVMNERTHFGAMSERDLVMLRDIQRIDVIRGPGSALYGPGAVSMVINIITHNAKTFQGTEVSGRMGGVEEFYSAEFKHGAMDPVQDLGVFLYAGAGKYLGADQSHAPQVYAFDFPDRAEYPWDPDDPGPDLPGRGYRAGTSFQGMSINRDGASHRARPPVKLHAQVTKGDWDIWARYTRGGRQIAPDMGTLVHFPWGWGDWVDEHASSSGYQQATGYIGYSREVRENLTLNAALSYDMFDFERILQGAVANAHREDEIYAKVLFNWDAHPRHKLAFGSEFSHEKFGLRSPGWPDGPTVHPVLGSPMPRWSTNMVSILGEHQWILSDRWTTFLGARLDDHTYSRNMFSPRAALVHTPGEKDTWKLMWSRSVRANFAGELKAAALAGDKNSKPEKLDSVELRHERRHTSRFDSAASVFVHYNLELLTWDGERTAPVGTQRQWGFELEANYRTERSRLGVSHGFTKLYDFNLEPGMDTVNTAYPYGYGLDLANWSNHISKIVGQRKLDEQWTFDGSFRVYWGFPGLRSYNEYMPGTMGPGSAPAIEPGWEKGYRGNYYLNLGLQYQPCRSLTVRLDGYNLLGIFDRDLNKRNYYTSLGDYRSHAPAIALWLIYQF
jgi:outer membrane receptor for ferrienterochelin and colicins